MLLLSDGALNDRRMEGIGDKRDNEVMVCDLRIEGLVVGNVEGDCAGELDAFGEFLCAFECSASCYRSTNDMKISQVLATHQQ